MSFKVIKSPHARHKGLAPFQYQNINPLGWPSNDDHGGNKVWPRVEHGDKSGTGLLNGARVPEAIKKEIFQEGYLQGEKAGRESAEQELKDCLERFAHSVEAVIELKKRLSNQVERNAIKLAVEIAKKIVKQQVQVDPYVALALVRVALSRVSEKSPVKLRVNSLDFEMLLERKSELCNPDNGDGLVFQADSSIQRGGCIVETDHGDIDARIESQFKEIEMSLLDVAPK